MPSECPICSSPVEQRHGEVAFYCTNKNCYAQRRRGVEHFVAKSALNIDGLGPKIIDKLFQAGLITDFADLYALKKEDLLGLENFKEKSADNLISAINDRCEVSLARFLTGLGIPHVGAGVADVLARELTLSHWPKAPNIAVAALARVIESLDAEYFESIDGIGEKVATSIVEYFDDHHNRAMFSKFAKHCLRLKLPHIASPDSKLAGKTFVLTGTLPHLSRDEATQFIKDGGGKVSGSVSKNTDYLVSGDNPGSKLEKAKNLGVKVLTEAQLKRLNQ